MATESSIHSDLAIPPGEYLEEVLGELGMTKDELARRMSRPASKMSSIFSGAKAVTPDTALQLEVVVGVPAHIWLGLETEYRLALARQQGEAGRQQIKDEARLVTAYCYRQLIKAGDVARTTKPADKVRELRRFFGVASLAAIPNVRTYEVAFRQAAATKARRSPEAVASWLRLAEKRAQGIETASFDRIRLRNAVKSIRALTTRDPEEFLPQLTALLAHAGVAFVLLPHFPGTGVNGVTFPTGRGSAVLAMTVRGARADIFWFSLFHELGHLLLHDRRQVILETEEADAENKTREDEADAFARDSLLAAADYAVFAANGDYSASSVRGFATEMGVAPGIVVGRLQHEGRLDHAWLNDLRDRYQWAGDGA